MSGALIMVWLGTAASLRAHEPDIDGWAYSRERRLEAPRAEPELPPARHDDAAAERIEALLAEARTETYSSDTAATEGSLDAAEKLVRDSSELPESAWLMAEILHERATVLSLRDAETAQEDERRARELAGPRATPFVAARTDKKTAKAIATPTAEELAPVATSGPVALDGPLPSDEVDVDGVEVSIPRTIPDGAHHVRVLRAGRLAWAGWITASGSGVRLAVAEPLPCSTTDLSPSSGATTPVACGDYVKARDAGVARIEVATCHHAACGPWLPWSRSWGGEFQGPIHSPRQPRRTSAWVLWSAAGVAAVIIGGFVLAEEGAFERRGPTRTRFEFEPPK